MNWEGYAFPFYFAIREYQESLKRGFTFYHPHGAIRTYIDGHDPYEPTDRIDGRAKFGRIASKFFQRGNNEVVGGIDAVVDVLNIVLDPANQPVLFHCFGGMHRSGMIAMLIRVMQGWKMEDIDAEYREYSGIFYREENVEFVKKFRWDIKFEEVQEKYRDLLK